MASVVAVCLQVAPSDGVLTDETTIRLKQTITPKQKEMMKTTKKAYMPPAIKEVGVLTQTMVATSSQVETLGVRKDDMEWTNSRRNGANWSDPWE
jgi:hypothetical protein